MTCFDLVTQKVSRFRKLSSYQPWLEDSFLVPFLTALKRVLRLTRLASLLAGICSAQIWPIVRFKRRLTWKWEKRKYPEKRPHRPIFSRWAWTHIETCRGWQIHAHWWVSENTPLPTWIGSLNLFKSVMTVQHNTQLPKKVMSWRSPKAFDGSSYEKEHFYKIGMGRKWNKVNVWVQEKGPKKFGYCNI